jgi:hypothetical protein
MDIKIKSKMETQKKITPPIRATIRFSSYPNEIWKEFFPKGSKRHYMISNLGRVASFDKGLHIDGYLLKISKGASVSGAKIALKVYEKGEELTRYGQPKSIIINMSLNIHNLVAEAFIENPEFKEIVNHKDCNKINNFIIYNFIKTIS